MNELKLLKKFMHDETNLFVYLFVIRYFVVYYFLRDKQSEVAQKYITCVNIKLVNDAPLQG